MLELVVIAAFREVVPSAEAHVKVLAPMVKVPGGLVDAPVLVKPPWSACAAGIEIAKRATARILLVCVGTFNLASEVFFIQAAPPLDRNLGIGLPRRVASHAAACVGVGPLIYSVRKNPMAWKVARPVST